MNGNKKVTIGITMGDPSGIGPEIILKSFERSSVKNLRIILIGDFNILQTVYNILKIKSFELKKISDLNDCVFTNEMLNVLDLHMVEMKTFQPGIVQAIAGDVAFEAVRKGVELALNRELDAIVTAPLNKEALFLAGHNYPGHTEILAGLTNTRDYAMLLYEKRLKIIHVSTHISLIEAITGLKRERIETIIDLADKIMRKLGADEPRIAVAGINPHAGEHGLFGKEEINEIIPAIGNMKRKGINVEGPCPPDTVFLQALKGKYDIVVAMYHDQGHIPLKLLGFENGVNVTVGLPFVRTSVDHGTAFDIAWQGKASERSMVEAIRLSLKLAR